MRLLGCFLCIAVLALLSQTGWAKQTAKPAAPDAGFVTEQAQIAWPKQPSVEEIFALPIFPEPLVPVGKMPSMDENKALLDALKRYYERKRVEDVSALTDYLDRYPASPWRVALLTNLGIHYYQTGYFSEALNAWEQAWKEGKDEKNPAGKAVVDRAVGELARMHARIGHTERLKALLTELDGRTLAGAATEYVTGARESLWRMENEPGISFICGSLALKNVVQTLHPLGVDLAPIQNARSGPHGFSLQEVQDIANAAKLPYRMAKRKPGAPLPLPAVAHWKVSHYAALVGEQNGLYHLKDPTFGDDLWISKSALEHETSGYYLIAATDKLPEGWDPVSSEEAKAVRGMGGIKGKSNKGDNPDKGKGGCPPPKGMAGYEFLPMMASLKVSDTPLQYTPAVGPQMDFAVTYIQREADQPANLNFSNLGPKWTHNWQSYIEDTPSNLSADVTLHRAGIGYDVFTGYDSTSRRFAVNPTYYDILERTQDSPVVYQRLLPDGSKEIYAKSGPAVGTTRQIFLTQVVDPQGNAVKLGYDAKGLSKNKLYKLEK